MNPFAAEHSARRLIELSGLAAKKSLGQHFLHDENILRMIVQGAGALQDKHLLEIGPGPGTLTRLLAAANPASFHAIEIDTRAAEHLQSLKELHPAFTLVEEDAMRVDIMRLVPAPRVIVSNLPYNVGTLLLVGWLQQLATHGPEAVSCMVLMFQKEVADRVLATPGSKDYGRVSVLAQWVCKVERLFDVAPSCFAPPPSVMSSVIRLTALPAPRAEAELTPLEKVLQAAFGQRRKMLRGALKSLRRDAESWLESAGIAPTRRAETLSVEEFCTLARTL